MTNRELAWTTVATVGFWCWTLICAAALLSRCV